MPFSIIGFTVGVRIFTRLSQVELLKIFSQQVVFVGDAKHFATPHGILGLIALLFTFIAGLFEIPTISSLARLKIFRGIILTVLLLLAIILFVTGFADIQAISLCAVQIPNAPMIVISILVMLSFVSGITAVGLRMLIGRWLRKVEVGNGRVRGMEGLKIEVLREDESSRLKF